jgi:hypothetical protein
MNEEIKKDQDKAETTKQDLSASELPESEMDEIVGGATISPRDAASGLPTGKRMHKPYTVTE